LKNKIISFKKLIYTLGGSNMLDKAPARKGAALSRGW
jgi:hypothetical protein